MLDDILLQVNKPGRYIGQEWNLPKKDFKKSNIKFALCFPDLYEVGMSNLGMRVVYGILNNIPDVTCERFFSLAFDFENILRHNHMEIFSLESKRRLQEFDIIGFSLGYELDYTNILNILELGKIPLKSSLRNQDYPLVMGGGPCVVNPEPLHEFFDLFVIGEAEDVILELIDTYRKYKAQFKTAKISKQDLLLMFSNIEGIYAPSLYDVIYNAEGKIKTFKPKIEGVPKRIKKRFVKDLNRTYFPLDWLIPNIAIVHDRITLEIMRGCPNTCRFCQARSVYFPFRQRELKNVLKLATETYKHTGYEEIALGGLSVSDYAHIEVLLKQLMSLFKEKCVGISLPSVKPKTMIGSLVGLIATVKKTGLTFAPEAATEKLRKILDKDFDSINFFKAIEQAYLSGYQHIKLYFMMGLPYEELEDLGAIIDFATQVSELRAQVNPTLSTTQRCYAVRKGGVNISVNTLIPKPHTPFQWLKTEDIENIKYKQDYLRKRVIKNKSLKVSFHNRYMSILEAIISRGDRRLSPVISYAFKRGARFDAWDSYFKFDTWMDAFNKFNINPAFYLKEKSPDELLPWDFLDTGVSKDSLLKQFNKVSECTIYGTE